MEIINNSIATHQVRILITDVTGKVLYKSTNAKETSIDLFNVFKIAQSMSNGNYSPANGEQIFGVYPTFINNSVVYVIGYRNYKRSVTYERFMASGVIFVFLIGFVGFVISFLLLTRRKMKYIEELASGVQTISTGNLDFRIKK
jgi:methyl-accepting chemotaxis protein